MEEIAQLFNQDISSVMLSIFIIMSSFIAIAEIIGKFSSIIGKPVRWVKKKNEDHDLLIQTANGLDDLNKRHNETVEQSIKHDYDIKRDLEKLTKICIDKEIDDWRWEILDFASALSSGRNYNRETFEHVVRIYEKYEKVLEENGLDNGLVTASMEVVYDVYKERIKNGFLKKN